jgi:hypothetical protein
MFGLCRIWGILDDFRTEDGVLGGNFRVLSRPKCFWLGNWGKRRKGAISLGPFVGSGTWKAFGA